MCTWACMGVHGCVCVCRGDACMQVQEKTFPFLLTSHVFDSVDGTGCCGVMETLPWKPDRNIRLRKEKCSRNHHGQTVAKSVVWKTMLTNLQLCYAEN